MEVSKLTKSRMHRSANASRIHMADKVVCTLVASMCLALGAVEQVNWTGAGDRSNTFGDPKNFRRWNNTTGKYENLLPEPGWMVNFEAGCPEMHVRDDDAALASGVTFSMSTNTLVYWDVTTNSVYKGMLYGSNGEFVKRGGNSVLQFTHYTQTSYDAHYTVAEGTLKLPSGVGKTNPFSVLVAGYCTVSNGATLALYEYDNNPETKFRWLKCYGTVTNAHAFSTNYLTQYYTDKVPSLIAETGTVGGKVFLRVGEGEFDIASTNCYFIRVNPRSSSTNQTVIGIAKFGMKGEAVSSIGSIETLSEETGNAAFDNVLYRYLGTGETTDKDFDFKLDRRYAERSVIHPFGIDGGLYGGAIFTGVWRAYETDGNNFLQVFRVTGSNTVPCQYNGTMTIRSSGGINYAPHILKDGPGVWRFNRNGSRSTANGIGLSGAFSIEEGMLQFDTLGEQGENCALGTAGDLYDKYYGAYDASKKVDWAYSFGTTNATGVADKEGILEHVGTNIAYAARRKISLLGNGRLKNSGTNKLAMRGVSARAPGEHIFTLDGTNTMTNAVAEVSDGVEGAHVSVVKTGSGKWWLKGNTTFSGDIVVNEGDLYVEANTNKFNWFRFTFRKSVKQAYMMPGELALYSKGGVRQNKYLTIPTGVPSGSSVAVRNEYFYLKPGEIYYGCPHSDAYQSGGNPITHFTRDDRSTSSYTGLAGFINKAPTESVAYSWVPITMRLKDTAMEIASFDICQSSWTEERQVTSYFVEGSQDGLNWQMLKDMPYGSFSLPGSNKWYSDGQPFVSGEVRKVSDDKGYAIAGHPEVSSLPNVRSVRVDAGAMLKTEYENVGEIRGLKVAAIGGGTIDGFKFAEEGSVDLVDVPSRGAVEMPINIVNDGGTKANIAGWPITVNGAVETRRSVEFTGTSFRIVPKGMYIMFN